MLTDDINVPDIDDPVEAVDSSGGEVVEAAAEAEAAEPMPAVR